MSASAPRHSAPPSWQHSPSRSRRVGANNLFLPSQAGAGAHAIRVASVSILAPRRCSLSLCRGLVARSFGVFRQKPPNRRRQPHSAHDRVGSASHAPFQLPYPVHKGLLVPPVKRPRKVSLHRRFCVLDLGLAPSSYAGACCKASVAQIAIEGEAAFVGALRLLSPPSPLACDLLRPAMAWGIPAALALQWPPAQLGGRMHVHPHLVAVHCTG